MLILSLYEVDDVNLVLESQSPKGPIPESLQANSGKKELIPELHASK